MYKVCWNISLVSQEHPKKEKFWHDKLMGNIYPVLSVYEIWLFSSKMVVVSRYKHQNFISHKKKKRNGPLHSSPKKKKTKKKQKTQLLIFNISLENAQR